MTREQADPTGGDDDLDALDAASREEILEMLEDGVREAHKKAVSGRVYDQENEKVRQGWLQRLGYLAKQYNAILNSRDDEQYEEIEENIRELTEQLNNPGELRADGGDSDR